MPPCSLSWPEVITSNAMSSRENPSALPQDRHTEFSNARCCPQLGQRKSRMGHCLFERRHVARGVDHASLRAGGAWVVIDCSHLHTAWVRAVWIRVLRGLNCIGAPVESPMLSTGIAAVAHPRHGATTALPATAHTIRRYLRR